MSAPCARRHVLHVVSLAPEKMQPVFFKAIPRNSMTDPIVITTYCIALVRHENPAVGLNTSHLCVRRRHSALVVGLQDDHAETCECTLAVQYYVTRTATYSLQASKTIVSVIYQQDIVRSSVV